MRRVRVLLLAGLTVASVLAVAAAAVAGTAVSTRDARVTSGSPSAPFPQNKQNNLYECNIAFRSVHGPSEPVVFSRSTDGGRTLSNSM
jgi:hypothetical protein